MVQDSIRAKLRAESRSNLLTPDEKIAMKAKAAEKIRWNVDLARDAAAKSDELFDRIFREELKKGCLYLVPEKRKVFRLLLANILLNKHNYLRLAMSENSYGDFYQLAAPDRQASGHCPWHDLRDTSLLPLKVTLSR